MVRTVRNLPLLKRKTKMTEVLNNVAVETVVEMPAADGVVDAVADGAAPAKVYKTARAGTLRAQYVDVMFANADKPMAEVLKALQAETGCSASYSRGVYKWLVENDFAPGVIEPVSRGRKASAEPKVKAPKAPKEKKVKEPKISAATGEKADSENLKEGSVAKKTQEELAAIREKNRSRIAEAHAKRKAKAKKEQEEPALEVEMPEVTETISTEDLKFIVG